MNSLFDPECHRQVLGNRQEAKEQKEGGRKENWSCKVSQAVWGRAYRGRQPLDSTGGRGG